MPKLLFKLHSAPEDEIEEVRELLKHHEFDIYETEAGRWGIGIAAIWLKNLEQLEQAQQVLFEYQKQRYENAQESRVEVEKLTIMQGLYIKFKQDPEQFILTLIGLSVVLGLTIYPFLNL